MYTTYCNPRPNNSFKIGIYGGLPAVISKECTRKEVYVGKDGGQVCKFCKELRAARGNSNPSGTLKNWYYKLQRAIERSNKAELTSLDIMEAKHFGAICSKYLNIEEGHLLREQSIAQVEYANHMSQLSENLPKKTYTLAAQDSCPGIDVLFKNAKQLCKDNPEFQHSLIVGLFRAAVVKQMNGMNAATEEKVVNFYRFMHTYNPKLSQVVSGNLNGPSDRWIRKLNAADTYECIIETGDYLEKIVGRMEAAINIRKDVFGKQVPFSLAIDATKVPQVLEMSQRYKAVLGGEYPHHLIDIGGKINMK